MKTRMMLLACVLALSAIPVGAEADAQQSSAAVTNCARPFSSAGNDQIEQDQIFILGNSTCSGRFTVHVTLHAQAQHSDGEGSEVSVSIHPIYRRQGQQILQTGPDICEGRPGVRDSRFDQANVACHVTRSLPAGQTSELSVHFFTNATRNQRMRTWWTYEPGL